MKTPKPALSDQDILLLKLAHLCADPLPRDFVGSEVNTRLWQAFELGKEWQRLETSEKS